MQFLALSNLLLASFAILIVSARELSSLPSAVDVIKAMESVGFQQNRSIAEMVSLVNQKVAVETGICTTRRLESDDEVLVLCGSDLQNGNKDLGSVPYGNPDGCPVLCAASVKDCNGVTWTDYNGGTCWLKFLGGQVAWFASAPKTGAISYMLTGRSIEGLRARTYVNADMIGGDIKSESNVPDSSYCAGECHFKDDCFASTWSEYNGGTCWYKNKASTLVAKPGTVLSLHYRVATVGQCKV